jgi:hypothetical protein
MIIVTVVIRDTWQDVMNSCHRCGKVDAGTEDSGGEALATIDNCCVKLDIMGSDCSSVEGNDEAIFSIQRSESA